MFGYLKRCCASVADQQGLTFEHIVVDAESTDGTTQWLESQRGVVSLIGPDDGMYDAINKGLRLMKADIVGHLNADEQYLPGTLKLVKSYFDRHPGVDILFGSTLIVGPDGSLVNYQKIYPVSAPLVMSSHLYAFTSSMFFRRRLIDRGEYFDVRYRVVGDMEYILRLLRKGYKAASIPQYLSAFTWTGSNLGLTAKHVPHEAQMLSALQPWWVKHFLVPWQLARKGLKLLSGAYFQGGPIAYAIYDGADAEARRQFCVDRATRAWPSAEGLWRGATDAQRV